MRTVLALVLALSISFALASAKDPVKRTVTVTAADGVRLAGNYYPAGKPGRGVLLFHQCSRDRLVWDDLARALANPGNHVLVLNPRGVGDSEGAQWDYDGDLEHALEYWRKNWATDAESAYQWLVAQHGVDRDNIVAIGAGCGSFLALLIAEGHYPSVRNVVFFSDFDDTPSRQFLRNSPDLSILSMVSEQDPMSFSAAKEIHALSQNPANRLKTYAQHAHGYGLLEQHPELMAVVVAWVQSRMAAR